MDVEFEGSFSLNNSIWTILIACSLAFGGCAGEVGNVGTSGDNGEAGPTGADGEAGPTGADGEAGTVGPDGVSQLVSITEEAAGDNCAHGGQRLEFGTDANGDGNLDADEVASTQYVCSPAPAAEIIFAKSQGAEGDCANGTVVTSYGVDSNQNGELETSEVAGIFEACNSAPVAEILHPGDVDCDTDIVITSESSDIDGSIASFEWSVVNSGSELTLTGTDTDTVTISSGMLVGGAILSLTVTDDFGGSSQSLVNVPFTGVNCTPLQGVYGVVPETCQSIGVGYEIDANGAYRELSGDDRGGVVLTSNYVYHTGDDALIRTDLALNNLEVLTEEDDSVDTLFSDSATGKLYAFIDSRALSDEGGPLVPQPTLWALAQNEGLERQSNNEFDAIAEIDEETGNLVDIKYVARLLGCPCERSYFIYGEGAEDFAFNYQEIQISMRNEQIIMLVRREPENVDDNALMVIRAHWSEEPSPIDDSNTFTSYTEADLDDGVINAESSTPMAPAAWLYFENDEDTFINAASYGDEMHFTVRSEYSGFSTFYSIAAEDSSANLISDTLLTECDVQSFAITPDFGAMYFHDEGACFLDFDTLDLDQGDFDEGPDFDEERIIKCDLLYGPNDGRIDDSGRPMNAPPVFFGGPGGPGGP